MEYPRLPIPPAIMVSEAQSFAQYTIRERLPAIIKQAIADNSFSQSALANLQSLAAELPNGAIRPIQADGGPDVAAWSTYVEPFEGNSWLNTPFYFAEAYFYRRILEAISYFQAQPGQAIDPFAIQKHASLATAMAAIRSIAPTTQPSTSPANHGWQPIDLIRFLSLALWGNRVDLSLWSATETSRVRTEVEQDEANILVNHSHLITDYLSQIRSARMDFVVDNGGFELACDLLLVDFLLSTHIAETVHLHLKPYPIFVSDAMIGDVHHTLAVLAADQDEGVRSLAARLQGFIRSDRLSLQDHFFWVAPLPFWEMPSGLKQELAQSNLVFVKGDANYRRLLGDCHWALTTPFEEVVNYFPAPLAALRTIKSEAMTGLRSEQAEQLTRDDPTWLINGQWGIIHFVNKAKTVF
ncbi:protein-glutamate O-methyltransferase family protein [Leptolyngbya sp. FACHB-16]|nr:protein-glutamate O-methyltransferase family protein [Leptolyngbya sp. FACHB-8]MBD2154256.1 protein-glutamate O-methyltransferase family protein [Leptolyngbya sp. FACHB-16]